MSATIEDDITAKHFVYACTRCGQTFPTDKGYKILKNQAGLCTGDLHERS